MGVPPVAMGTKHVATWSVNVAWWHVLWAMLWFRQRRCGERPARR